MMVVCVCGNMQNLGIDEAVEQEYNWNYVWCWTFSCCFIVLWQGVVGARTTNSKPLSSAVAIHIWQLHLSYVCCCVLTFGDVHYNHFPPLGEWVNGFNTSLFNYVYNFLVAKFPIPSQGWYQDPGSFNYEVVYFLQYERFNPQPFCFPLSC